MTLTALNDSFGLPLYSGIIVATLLMRAALLPVTAFQMRAAARFTAIAPEVNALRKEMEVTPSSTMEDKARAFEAASKLAQLSKTSGANPLYIVPPMIATTLIFISFFFALQDMAANPSSGLATGGTLWFRDLSAPDPTFVLVFLSWATLVASFEFGTEAAALKSNPAQQRMMRIMSLALPAFLYKLPSAVLLFWISSNVLSVAQARLFLLPAVKRLFKLP